MLQVENKNTVLWVTLDRPEIHNAFNDELIEKMTKVFHEASQDDDVSLVVLTGNGRSFCAGADLNWMKSMVNYSMEENIHDSEKLDGLFKAINNCSKPVIGKVNGHALGGGVGLVSVCDYVIASEKAKFGFTEVRLGLIPAVISPYVINKIGESHARAWFMSGERFDTHQAFKLNLVHQVVDASRLDEKCDEVIASFMAAAPEAAIHAKSLIKNVLSKEHSNISDYTCRAIAERRISEEGQEGMNALLEKRAPTWKRI